MIPNVWTKSSRSTNISSCVETIAMESINEVGVRDSKNLDNDHLTFSADSWNCFIAGIKAGEFDL